MNIFEQKETVYTVIRYLCDDLSEEKFKEILESRFDCFINLRHQSQVIFFLSKSLKEIIS